MMKTVAIKDVRAYFAGYFEEKAAFRERKADESPWTAEKNGSYAVSLHRMAACVAALPDDDSTLQALANCAALYDENLDLFRIPALLEGPAFSADVDAMHCGPRGKPLEETECKKWFADWAKGLIEVAPEWREACEQELRELIGKDD